MWVLLPIVHFALLTAEAHTHLLWERSMVQNCWINVLVSLGLNPGALSSFAAGDWILKPIAAGSDESLARAIIANTLRLIWKNRSNTVFRRSITNRNNIPFKAWNLAKEYTNRTKNINREFSCPILSSSHITIYTDASWIDPNSFSGLGFLAVKQV